MPEDALSQFVEIVDEQEEEAEAEEETEQALAEQEIQEKEVQSKKPSVTAGDDEPMVEQEEEEVGASQIAR